VRRVLVLVACLISAPVGADRVGPACAAAQEASAGPAAAVRQTGGVRRPQITSDTSRVGAPGFPVLRRRFEELRRRRVAQFLHLDPAQADAVQREFVDFRRRQQELRVERKRLIDDLQDALDRRDAEETLLRDRVDALRRNQQERERSVARLKERLSRELTLEQQARLMLFAERFQGEVAQGLRRIQERRETAGAEPATPPGGP
jgi:hypothetical protein